MTPSSISLLRPRAPRRRPAALPAARRAALCAALFATLFAAPPAQASGLDPYAGELMLFGGNFCPNGWLPADGRLLEISQHDVLYGLLGTTYGGNGQTTFGLPDLRGRSAVGTGQGPNLTNRGLGSQAGAESATLTPNQLPAHTHTVPASTQPATHATPAPGRVPATAQNGGAYASGGMAVPLAGGTAGSGHPFSVRSPYLAMQWCIATEGISPTQN